MIYWHKTIGNDRKKNKFSRHIHVGRCWKVRSSRFSSRRFLTGLTRKKETLKVTTSIHCFKTEEVWRRQLTLALAPQFGNILTWRYHFNFKVKEVKRKMRKKVLEKSCCCNCGDHRKRCSMQKLSEKSHWKLIVGGKWSDFKCFLGKSVSKTEIASMKIDFGTSLEKCFCFLFTNSPKALSR